MAGVKLCSQPDIKVGIITLILMLSSRPALTITRPPLTIVTPPVDQVVAVGSDVLLHCEVDLREFLFRWTIHTDQGSSEDIFVYYNGLEFGETNYPEKYEVYRNFTLRIKSISLDDAGQYTCMIAPVTQVTVNVVVIDEPAIPEVLEMTEGENFTFSCETKFAGWPSDEQPTPVLNLYFDGVKEHTVTEVTAGQLGLSYWNAKTDLIQIIDDKFTPESFSCEVTTHDPELTISTTSIISIKRAVSGMYFKPDQSEYEVGDVIECVATGNPKPEIWWKAVTSNGPRPVSIANLEVTTNMIGKNIWICNAQNTIDANGPITIQQQLEFYVGVIDTEETEEEFSYKSSSIASSVIIVAIVVPLVVVILVLALIFYIRKRRVAVFKTAEAENTHWREPPIDDDEVTKLCDPHQDIDTTLRKPPSISANQPVIDTTLRTPATSAPRIANGDHLNGTAV